MENELAMGIATGAVRRLFHRKHHDADAGDGNHFGKGFIGAVDEGSECGIFGEPTTVLAYTGVVNKVSLDSWLESYWTLLVAENT